MNETVAAIKAIIADKMSVPPSYLDEDFTLDEMGLDSLMAAEVVLGVEERFAVALDMPRIAQSLKPETKLNELLALVSGMVHA
jgi:acyl carrier protein